MRSVWFRYIVYVLVFFVLEILNKGLIFLLIITFVSSLFEPAPKFLPRATDVHRSSSVVTYLEENDFCHQIPLTKSRRFGPEVVAFFALRFQRHQFRSS